MLYDIVKRYVRYISSSETSLVWNKAMSVKPIYFVSRTIGETSSYFNVIFLGRFSTGENTNVRMASPLLLRCSFGWRQVLHSERIMVYKLERFLQYSTLYIPWRNAYLYRGMNHMVYIGHFSAIRINSYIPFWHNHATHACKFCMRIHVAVEI